MDLLDNLFNNKKKSGGGGGGGSNNNKNNNIFGFGLNKNRGAMRGQGRSLGGSKPGTVHTIVLERSGRVGIEAEKTTTASPSAIVKTVMPGSQAEAAGLRRGDVLCYPETNGQDEMPYEEFLKLARSNNRPIVLDVRRLDQTSAVRGAGGGSADKEARRKEMLAAAENRDKKHKAQTKPVKHVTKSTLLKQQQQQQNLPAPSMEPQSEASKRAALAAKRGEANLAAELGYNPYEAIKKTAGQARAATTTTQHGAITAPSGGGATTTSTSSGYLPAVAPPTNPTTQAEEEEEPATTTIGEDDPRFHEFEVALATAASFSDPKASRNGLGIARTLIRNATTKGQDTSGNANAEKFRRVRLANAKIRAAIVDVPGNLDLMLSVGFVMIPDEANPDESLLHFPSGNKGPPWLSRALKAMEKVETGL